jgi:hypothetical protein
MDEIKSRSPYWLSPGIDVPIGLGLNRSRGSGLRMWQRGVSLRS